MKYVAELAHVREVSLHGSADLGFWAERLRGEGLTPVEHAGRVRVLVVACDSKFFGVRFRELSFSVFVRRPDASGGVVRPAPSADAALLVQAFNSSRFFAWSERTWFSTPYRHGMIDVDVGLPAAMRLGLEGQTVFSAVMSADSRRAPSHSGTEGFDGPIFLPRSTREKTTSERLFFAKIEGETQAYPFWLFRRSGEVTNRHEIVSSFNRKPLPTFRPSRSKLRCFCRRSISPRFDLAST